MNLYVVAGLLAFSILVVIAVAYYNYYTNR
jgi:hypothetical protein